ASALTSDAPTSGSTGDFSGSTGGTSDAPSGGITFDANSGFGDPSTSGTGVLDSMGGSGDGSGGSTGDAPGGSATFTGVNIPMGSYLCNAGGIFCPPADAGSSDGSSSDGTTGGDSSGSTADAPSGGDSGGSATSGGSGSSNGKGPKHYSCTSDGSTIDCTSTDASCGAGMEPSATGGCVPAGSSGGTTGDGATGGSASGGSASGGAAGGTGDGASTSGDGSGGIDSNGMKTTFQGSKDNGDGTSDWTYEVEEMPGSQDLSNWVLGTNCGIVGQNPTSGAEVVRPDPNAGITGVKWETQSDAFAKGTFTVTVRGNARPGTVSYATKAPKVTTGSITGPVCN
ncbi:MAG: hypothetical protein KC766_28735, partial [Myxococcales bacterium]|nr:hypothetical protein [Myxococcales bacterium]